MKRVIIIVVVLLVVAAVAVGGWWYTSQHPEVWSTIRTGLQAVVDELGLEPEQEIQGITASGFIEADTASLTTEMGGRVVELYANEGDFVNQGDVLAMLDDSLLLAQIEMAKAELRVAEATLDLVKAGVREETLAYAQSQVVQAEAVRDGAHVAWADAEAMLNNPQEMELAITAARAQLRVLRHQTAQAQALANSAQVGRDLSVEIVSMLENTAPFLPPSALPSARREQALATYHSWVAWTGAEQAEAALSGAERYLAELERQRANPLDLEAEAHEAEAQYRVASAGVELARAQLAGLKIGATPEQIAAAEAQVEVARSGLAVLVAQHAKLELRSPISGLVLERSMHIGEVAMPGSPLLTLADLDSLTLTIYVPEDQLGKVRLGHTVTVTVDAYPDRVFMGTVVMISSQAEFTPKNVQTQEERVSMVFAVEVTLPNADHALKPGMPADAILPEVSRQLRN